MSRWLPGSLGRYLAYNKYLALHKWYVLKAAWIMDVPLLGLLHDLSKYYWDEQSAYARHFYEPDGSKRTWQAEDGFYSDPDNDTKFDRAWLGHIRRNKHHPQHWVEAFDVRCDCWRESDRFRPNPYVLLRDDTSISCMACLRKLPRAAARLVTFEMPPRYRKEMLADWMGAGAAQGTPDTLGWYAARGKHLPLGPETRAWVERQLGYEREPAERHG